MTNDLYFKNNAIYNIHALRDQFPNLSLPMGMDEDFIRNLGFKPVRIDERPANTSLQYAVIWEREEETEYVKGWKLVDKPQEVIAVQEENARLELERGELKADNLIQNFISKTPTEVNSYINDNVTDLQSAKAVIKMLARIVLVIARREYR